MSYTWQRWLADEFRAAGLEVVEIDGWENRGRPASTGHFYGDVGPTTHHTGSTSSPANPRPSLQTLITGRSDLPGPLSHWAVDYNGVVIVIAAGRANHAGSVGKSVPFAAIGSDGNALFLGDEVMTNGTQDLPPAQRHAIAVTNAVVLLHFHHGPDRAHRHADISGTGKWDIGQLTTAQLRDDAERAIEEINMPSAEEIARAVWNADLTVGEDRVRAGRVLVQTFNRANVAPRLKTIEQALEQLADEAGDDATRGQARRILVELRETQQLVEAHAAEQGDGAPHA